MPSLVKHENNRCCSDYEKINREYPVHNRAEPGGQVVRTLKRGNAVKHPGGDEPDGSKGEVDTSSKLMTEHGGTFYLSGCSYPSNALGAGTF